ESSDDTSRLHRDIEHTDKDLFSVDRQQGDIDVTVDHRLLSEEGRAQIKEDVKRTELAGKSLADVALEDSVTLADTFEHMDVVQKELDVQLLIAQKNGDAAVNINNLDSATAEQKQTAINDYAAAYSEVFGISIESALVIAVNKAIGGAHYIDESGKSNIVLNDESMQNAQDYMSTLAHEVTHGLEKQGVIGDKGEQSENYANLVGEYAEGNYEFALENSGLGEVRDGDVNQHLGNNGELVSKNTVKFWGELNSNDDIDFHLNREEVDKLINGTPEEQAEMRRLDLTRDLDLRTACQDAQSAACNSAIENAKANKATLEEDADPFDDIAYGQELESIRSELNDPSGANREQDEALLYGAIGLIADFTPGVGDAKGLAEAETGIDYLLATIGVVPLAGDLIQKAANAFDAGDVKLAQEYIQEARKTLDDSPELLDYNPDAPKLPDVEQLANISLKPKKGTLRGEPETPPANANSDMIRAIDRQNESAELLSNHGLEIEHLPNTGKKGGNPDISIGGRPADVYSPKSKNPNTIWDNMTYKVGHQAPDIVLNISDSPLSSSDILKFLDEKPVDGLKELYIIDGKDVILKRF
ncbi:DUF6862 domain-containing protein, partial [Vibrio neptunius]|nr:hypothetical protein [Vibrio neptunius]MBN3518304.1 hypothetical protein [Vibrio neptunius]MBN3552613.1 hypothetical protein [Vibrio neptunius]MBN3580690.1 hypothetical protein [Vibrio neptunius]MCH9874356.1 hypothetical protein [Vibrio neptunius]